MIARHRHSPLAACAALALLFGPTPSAYASALARTPPAPEQPEPAPPEVTAPDPTLPEALPPGPSPQPPPAPPAPITPAAPERSAPAPAEHPSATHSLSEYPQLTPAEIGRRFLRLIAGVKQIGDLFLQRMTDVMDLPMQPAPQGKHSFSLALADSGWQFTLSHVRQPHDGKIGAFLEFTHPNRDADMAPVCAMDFNAYLAIVEDMGFDRKTPVFTERMAAALFVRNDVLLGIEVRPEGASSDEKREHACVKSIGITRVSK